MHRLLKAIVVEDNEPVREVLKLSLRTDPQIQIAEAATLSAGVGLCKAERQLVLIVDLGLPDTNGIEAVPILRQTVPAATLVVMTGDDTLREQAMMAGAHAIIIKGSPESHGAGLVHAVRTAVVNHDLELLNAAALRRANNVEHKLNAAKKLLPAALVWVGTFISYSHDRADAAERMRDRNELRVMVAESGAERFDSQSAGL